MKKTSVLLLVVAGIVMFVLTSLQSYTLSDDVLYHCIWRWTSEEGFTKISSLSDIIRSNIIHYQVITGRVVVQVVAQSFLAFFCKPVYDVANAIVFVLTAWMSAKYVSGGRSMRTITVMMVLFIMMVMIPGFVDDYLWIEGSVNYLWVSLAMMGMIFVFEKNDGRDTTLKDYVVSPLMLLVGWTHEGAAVPLAIALLVHCALKRRKGRNAAWLYVAWFTIGAFLCALAPSTVLRAIGDEGHVVASPLAKVAFGLFTCTKMRTVWLLAIVMAYAYKKQKRLLVWHVKRFDYLYMAVVLCIGVIFVSGVTQSRVCYFTEFFSMLLVVNLLLKMGIMRHSARMAVAMGTVMVLMLIPGIYYSYEGYANYKYIMAQIAKGDSDIIRVRQVAGCDYFIKKFTFPQVEFGSNTYYFAPDSTDENVRCAATLLGRERLVFLPDDMVGKIMDTPDSSLITDGESLFGGLIAMQIPSDKKVERVTFVLGEDTQPFYKKPFIYGGYTYDAPRWQVIEVNGRNFVFFDKPVPKIYRRVKDIKIL